MHVRGAWPAMPYTLYTVYTPIGGKGRCHTSCDLQYHSMQARKSAGERSTLALKPMRKDTRSPKREQSVAPQNGHLSNKNFRKKRKRSITVSALLSYAIRITHSARSNVQKAIKNAPSEEVLQKKITEQESYTELVDIILGVITDLSDVCDLNKNDKTYIEKIKSMINFMRERGIKPGCKTRTREIKFSDFTYTENDAEIMNSARDIINSKMNREELVKQWKTNNDREIRAKNKVKQREIWEKWWGEFLTPHREPKDPETSSTISMGYNTMGTSTYTKEL